MVPIPPIRRPAWDPISSGDSISLNAPTGVVFKTRAFFSNFQPSDVVSNVFMAGDFIPNTLAFGFTSGEASAISSPRQARLSTPPFP